MIGFNLLLLLFSCSFAQTTYPMRNIPLEIQGFYYGYDNCMSLDESHLDNNGIVLNVEEVVNVRKCTTMIAVTGNGGTVLLARGQNVNGVAAMCNVPVQNWPYKDIDASPISMSYPLVSGDEPESFLITLSDGTQHNPVCVTMVPANENNEMKTINLFGEDFGDGRNYTRYPVQIDIIGDVFFNVNGKLVNGNGLSFREKDDTYQFMRYTSTLRMLEAKAVPFDASGDNNPGGANDCISAGFINTTNVIRVRMSGGGTQNGLMGLTSDQSTAFLLRDTLGKILTNGYLGVADLNNDGDNNFDMCLDDTFDLDALDNILLRCYDDDLIVPPKGPDFPCASHSLSIDKSRLSTDYVSACKCDFDNFFDAVCDPESSLPDGHPLQGRNYCQVNVETSTCTDIFIDSEGTSMSYDACNFRVPQWRDEMTECLGLVEDLGAPTAEICKVNCEEDDECEVYQFHRDGTCSRGTSMDCTGSITVIAGGRKEAPLVDILEEFSCTSQGCGISRRFEGDSSLSYIVQIRETDFASENEYVTIFIDGTIVQQCDPQKSLSEEWYSCEAFELQSDGEHLLSVVASSDVLDLGYGYVVAARLQIHCTRCVIPTPVEPTYTLTVPHSYGLAAECTNLGCQTLDLVDGASTCAHICSSQENCNVFNYCPEGADCTSGEGRCCTRHCASTSGSDLSLTDRWNGWDVYTEDSEPQPDTPTYEIAVPHNEGLASNCQNLGCQTLNTVNGASTCADICSSHETCNVFNYCPEGADCTSGEGRCCIRRCASTSESDLQLTGRWNGWDVYIRHQVAAVRGGRLLRL